jgi:hypothetical protein
MPLYLSASLFTAAEQAFNRDLAAALRSAGYSVFLPQEIDQTQDQKAIFDLSVQELKACDLVLAIIDGPDVASLDDRTHGKQEGSEYNGHFKSECFPPNWRNVSFSAKLSRKCPMRRGIKPFGSAQWLFNRRKARMEGLKHGNRGSCRILRIIDRKE